MTAEIFYFQLCCRAVIDAGVFAFAKRCFRFLTLRPCFRRAPTHHHLFASLARPFLFDVGAGGCDDLRGDRAWRTTRATAIGGHGVFSAGIVVGVDNAQVKG